ncbi:NAD(P)-dependent oxidoreductase [Methanobacterium sp. 42_16]|uniref:NAD-dependent epimerase/dehydratase family protein n=1 Tax=Methanobacterium sp. 42_16 TaxID=1641383 RepID=UPI0007479303|nr:NAD-dependent epimerase/dehydratase family protein [Methanobacterium sp. 42_16]KUK72202.1 MAG: Nucleoside-diphosphate-sugar epimerase [Methanobacterium sp. 42_16]
MMNNPKILITGATGFIGSHLTSKLLKKEYKVGIIKRKNSNLWRIKDILDKLTVYDTDISNTEKVMEVFSDFKPDIVIHLATYYAVDHESYEIPLIINTNVTGILNLLEASKENSVDLFINTSSCFVYGVSDDKISEDDELNPLNLYALSKIESEQACAFYSEKYGLKTITFRVFPPYGPADNPRKLIPFIIKNLLNNDLLEMTSGKQRWDFIYVEDVADAYIELIKNFDELKDNDVFNLGTGKSTSIREVLNILNQFAGDYGEAVWGAIPHRENEVWNICADIKKAGKVFNWKPKTSIENGLKLTYDWYESFGSGDKNE